MPKRKLAVSTSKETEEGYEVKKQKVVGEADRPCPNCGKEFHLIWTRVTKVEPVRGEYEQEITVTRSLETSLEEHMT